MLACVEPSYEKIMLDAKRDLQIYESDILPQAFSWNERATKNSTLDLSTFLECMLIYSLSSINVIFLEETNGG